MTSLPGGEAAQVYSELISEQLDEERCRKVSLEQRGFFVITSSGVIVTALFGLASVTSEPAISDASPSIDGPLTWALAGFVLSVILGLVTNVPVNYKEPTPDSLDDAISDEDLGSETEQDALRVAADARLSTLRSYREKNGTKAWILTAAFGAEALGATLVAYVAYLRI